MLKMKAETRLEIKACYPKHHLKLVANEVGCDTMLG